MKAQHPEAGEIEMHEVSDGTPIGFRTADNGSSMDSVDLTNVKPPEDRTLAEWRDLYEGMAMTCDQLLVMVDSLKRQNHKLSITAQKAVIKAAAYKEMLHENLFTQTQDHMEDFDGPSDSASDSHSPETT